MTYMATLYRRPVGAMRHSVKPQLASWEQAAHPSRMKLRRFLAQVDAVAGPALAAVSGRVAVELIVGFSDGISLTEGGHDLDKLLVPGRSAAGPAEGRGHFRPQGPRTLVISGGARQPDTAGPSPQFSTRMAGSYERRQWKQQLHDRLAVQVPPIDPGPAGLAIALMTGPGRNWASLWKPLIDAFGPVLGEDPTRPFHPYDDRIVSLAVVTGGFRSWCRGLSAPGP